MTDDTTAIDSPAAFESALEDLVRAAIAEDVAVEGGWECSIADGPDLDVLITRIASSD